MSLVIQVNCHVVVKQWVCGGVIACREVCNAHASKL